MIDLINFFENAKGAPFIKNLFEKEAIKSGFKYNKNNDFIEKSIYSKGNSIAFVNVVDKKKPFVLISCHLDFPQLKVKPQAISFNDHHLLLNLELYGSPIIGTWFDRNLAMAGVVYLKNDSKVEEFLFDSVNPVAIIANPAIHLLRTQNDTRSYDKQKELKAIVADKNIGNLFELIKNGLPDRFKNNKIIEHQLYLYDIQKAAAWGADNKFISAQALDNGLSCFSVLNILKESKLDRNIILLAYDNEEIGSKSYSGAESNLVEAALLNINYSLTDTIKMLNKSVFVSLDVAHGYNPNYPEFYDPMHRSILGQGPVIKFSAANKYATGGLLSSEMKNIFLDNNIQFQEYVTHNNLIAGSTVGPIVSTKYSMPTIDIGVPILAMHSIRETCHLDDIVLINKFLMLLANDGKYSFKVLDN